jgi:uncharacterized protein (DUF1778 family)
VAQRCDACQVTGRLPTQSLDVVDSAAMHAFLGVLTTATQVVRIRVFVVYTDDLQEHHMRDAAINLRAKPEQRDLIDQAASMLGKNRSDFMLEAACDRAQSVLLDQVYFRLDERRFKDFVRLLDAPPAANAGLERLMAVKAPWAEPAARKASR